MRPQQVFPAGRENSCRLARAPVVVRGRSRVARAGAALREATTDPALIARMAEQGVALTTGDDAALRRVLAEETEMWGRLIREQNIRPE